MRVIIRCCLLWILVNLAGCAGIEVSSVTANDYVALRRGDVLTTGQLSTFTKTSLLVLGLNGDSCLGQNALHCRKALLGTTALSNEQRLSALSELWLQEAFLLSRHDALSSPERSNRALNAYIESARYAYAYLFMTERTPQMRAMEDRQTQVRDYYNFATQQMVSQLFERYKEPSQREKDEQTGNFVLYFDHWKIDGYMDHTQTLVSKMLLPKRLIPATELTFKGLRNVYRRDGVGAELVAENAYAPGSQYQPWQEIPFPEISVISVFSGNTLDDVLHTNQVSLIGFNPYRRSEVTINHIPMPLAANFTSSYGLWLAHSGFARQAFFTLFGVGDVLNRAKIYMMQPYDPNRRIIIMMHGLASSPETWVNLANEIMGDEVLRQRYQIWQVYYPTNLPLMVNLYEIRQAVLATLNHVDPERQSPSSRNMVLIGHSMGGVLARLLVSSSGDHVWDAISEDISPAPDVQEKVKKQIDKYVLFEPLDGVTSAIFIAAPHRGTPFAENTLARMIAKLVSLPVTLVKNIDDLLTLTRDSNDASRETAQAFTSINSLSDKDIFMKASENLPISPAVKYYSIIGNDTPDKPLADSTDGVVPYQSVHLSGAVSEKVIPSWHDVQQKPEAIVEIRRILHQQ